MFDPQNPFPARVMANRIWHHLFGRGIVSSTDDFGGLGSVPTHPELLDWLAREFRGGENPWSVKDLVRTIVTSDVYRRASDPASDRATQIDPNNELLSTGRVRRLTAEEKYFGVTEHSISIFYWWEIHSEWFYTTMKIHCR